MARPLGSKNKPREFTSPEKLENLKGGQFKKGHDPRRLPGGRPEGMKLEINNNFLKVLAKDFQEHGAGAVEAMREGNPVAYCQMIAAMQPKEVKLDADVQHTHQFGPVSDTHRWLAGVLGIGSEDAPSQPLLN